MTYIPHLGSDKTKPLNATIMPIWRGADGPEYIDLNTGYRALEADDPNLRPTKAETPAAPLLKADKAIAEMVREAATLGVKGTEEWLKGLYELFGGGIGRAYLDTIAQANQSPRWKRYRRNSRRQKIRRRRGSDPGSDTGLDAVGTARRPLDLSEIEIEETERAARVGELTDSVYEDYQPAYLRIPGAKPHAGNLFESAAMAVADPPRPTCTPDLPKATVIEGKQRCPLSD